MIGGKRSEQGQKMSRRFFFFFLKPFDNKKNYSSRGVKSQEADRKLLNDVCINVLI